MTVMKRIHFFLIFILLGLSGCALYNLRDRNEGYDAAILLPNRTDRMSGSPVIRAGFGRTIITPVIGDVMIDRNKDGRYSVSQRDGFIDRNGNGRFDPVWLAGFKTGRPASRVHDDLYATVSVVDDGSFRMALISLDIIGLMHDDVIDIRRQLPASLGVHHAIICSTHNHEGPDTMGNWGRAPLDSGVDPHYMGLLKSRVVEAVAQAVKTLQEVEVRTVTVPNVREGLVEDSRLPEVYDNDLHIVRFVARSGGATVGTWVNWSNHPEVTWDKNTEITSDFPATLRSGIESGLVYEGQLKRPGLGGLCLYLNGACGGLMTTRASMKVKDPITETVYQEPSHEKARAVGYSVALRGLDAVNGGQETILSPSLLNLKVRTLEIPLENSLFYLGAATGMIPNRGLTSSGRMRTEVNLLVWGDLSLACIPGEIYPELVNGGVAKPQHADYSAESSDVTPLRRMIPGKTKLVVGLANDEIGYIIPKTQWDVKAPYAYERDKSPQYGEQNSPGPDTAPLIMKALEELSQSP